MLLRDRGVHRPVPLGPFPLEALARDPHNLPELGRATEAPPPTNDLAQAAQEYIEYFAAFADGNPAPHVAPVADDTRIRTDEIKGAAYYFDASQVGICHVPELEQPFVVVLLIAHGRTPEPDNRAHAWISGAEAHLARMRGAEIACSIAGHIRAMGFAARAHLAGQTDLDLHALAVRAGVAVRTEGGVSNPFLGRSFEPVAISTTYELETDTPLAQHAAPNPIRHWFGINGATSGRELARRAGRASHLGPYAMETVKRVDEPTTRIYADEVPRVPKRAEFFMRARMGDLGEKAQREVQRFAFKHPVTHGMMPVLRSMVPHQGGEPADGMDPALTDATANTRAIKSLAYNLGADMVGICEMPDYAWYSHRADGTAVEPYHKYAVVMLIDQGYDTMEGASGDDWISGCQSMRGYIRGAEIAGVMASFLRRRGVSARSQTNADSDVLQIPLVLLAGLGELARIGELVLNPFLGPRMKSVVLTTNLVLETDRPVDFGLQYFCSNCLKCARECPVNAIPFGGKVMFNGYEIWKPDVERCTRYRVTNPKGSACGRCMKTCPLNKVVTADGSLVHRLGTWLGIRAPFLKPVLVPLAVWLDDRLGFGKRNATKRWWQDLEVVDGRVQKPKATNERDLDLDADVTGNKSPVGYYHASDMPPPDSKDPVPANHKQAIERAAKVESVADAAARRARGGEAPPHYIPTRTI